MRALSIGALCLVLGASASCRAQQAPRTPRTVVHHVLDNATLVERGDTLLWVRGPSETVPRDSIGPDGKPVVLVALLLPDSTFVLLSGRRTPMNPALAKHLRAILQMARDEGAGRLPKPPTR
jgi:hypothetical protein